ncbi:MAG TPA: ABC transporter permease [Opitutus sp.]|nr:ABC transporter permease [Opitutus sp.]
MPEPAKAPQLPPDTVAPLPLEAASGATIGATMGQPSLPPDGAAPAAADAGRASQWQLIRRRFARHRVALASLFMLAVLYVLAAFAEFFAPYSSHWRNLPHAYCPPQLPRVSAAHGVYVPAMTRHVDPVTFKKSYIEDPAQPIALGFFVRGEPYKLWGLIPWDRHFFGVKNPAKLPDGTTPTFFFLGSDKYGHDVFSRLIFGARISLSVGLVAIAVTFLLGVTIGGISGYIGGKTDNVIQRLIEIVNAFPQLPLWLALGAVLPPDWSPLEVYFAITIVLSLLGWTALARVVRGKILSLREEDYATAARLIGASHARILFRHLLPGFTSHIIVVLTMSVPAMILGETSLSFLNLGLRPPIVSWGVMLQDCMSIQTVANYPWLLFPVVLIVLAVLSFNFLGDGLRDAADPYSGR